jgi:hypothetical protein
VAFPFIAAALPATAYWGDGRFGIFLPYLLAGSFAFALADAVHRRQPSHAPLRRTRASTDGLRIAVLSIALLGASGLTVAGAHAGGAFQTQPGISSGFGDPNEGLRTIVAGLQARHIDDAYAGYWTAYPLELIGGGRIRVSPSVFDVDRTPALARAVARSPHPAWLFYSPAGSAKAYALFAAAIPGAGTYTESSFEEALGKLGIGYKVVHVGPLDAVVPDRRVVNPQSEGVQGG